MVLAATGRRLGAFALDGVFIGMIIVAGLVVGGSIVEAAISPATTISPAAASSPGVLAGTLVYLLTIVATPFVYPAVGWRSGATPAMRILGLRVVDARGGDRLGWGQALLRTAGWWWSLLTCGAGFIPALADAWRRGLPDRMASSLVVAIRPLPLAWVPGPVRLDHGAGPAADARPARPHRPGRLRPAGDPDRVDLDRRGPGADRPPADHLRGQLGRRDHRAGARTSPPARAGRSRSRTRTRSPSTAPACS